MTGARSEAAEVDLVLVTGPDAETLAGIARALLEEGLIACANILPGVFSIYRWEGAVHEEGEALAIFKTTAEAVGPLTSRVLELHPYDVPEVVCVPVASGAAPYLDWVRRQVGRVRPPEAADRADSPPGTTPRT